MVDNDQEGMSQGHSCPFLTTAKGNMVVLVREITRLTMRGCVRCFDEGCAQPLTPFACLSTEALARTFPVARAHSRPGSQMCSVGEAGHVWPDFSQKRFSQASFNARNSLQAQE